jgi:autotransporter-associated beta strand protein
VQQGGGLTLAGSFSVNGNSVTGGSGGDASAGQGSAFGSGMFLQGSGTLTFAPGANQSQSISDVIADQTGVGGTGANAGSWRLRLNGAGTLVLAAAQAYSGGTTVDAGLLQLGAAGSLASGGNLTVNGGTFDLNGHDQTVGDLSGTGGAIALGSDVLTAGTAKTAAFAGAISGSGLFVKTGAGTLTLTGASNYTGGTVILDGTLQLGDGGAGGSITGLVIDSSAFAINRSDIFTLAGAVGGSGAFQQLGTGGAIPGNVTFAGVRGAATLRLDTGTSQLGGSIVGFAVGDSIDLAFVSFDPSLSAIWQENASNTGGVLSLVASGSTVAALNLSGQYTSADFSIASDGQGGASIAFANPPPADGTTAHMVLRHVSGQYELYNIANNAILGAYPLGPAGIDWTFVTLGGFFGSGSSGMMLRNSTTGAFQVYDISNNNITSSAALGTVGLNWQVAGFGDFASLGETDMILRDSASGGFQVYDIANNAITASAFMGTVGLNWQVGGFGSFSSSASSGMILRDATTGALQVYDISNNQFTNSASMGAVGLDWRIEGFGDFSSSPGETDMLMRNVNSGELLLYDIANNQITGATFLGPVGLDWQFAGVAPIQAPGTSDLVLRNANTGQFQVYNIANNQITGSASLGQVGLDWQLGGFAPATSTDSPAAVSQLVQAMSSFSPNAGTAVGATALEPQNAQAAQMLAAQPLSSSHA